VFQRACSPHKDFRVFASYYAVVRAALRYSTVRFSVTLCDIPGAPAPTVIV
jgi:hypothetical protein